MQTNYSRRPRRSRSQSFTGTNRSNRLGHRPAGRRRSSHHGSSRGRKRVQPTFNPAQFINRTPLEVSESIYNNQHARFTDFTLHERIQKNIAASGLETPSPIQDQIIPEILHGRDVIGLAQTGTGKTAAFLIPLLDRMLRAETHRCLILTPTRELAIQIEAEFHKLATGTTLRAVTCVGGMPIGPQIRNLRRKPSCIIGTPGRILDLIERKNIRTQDIDAVVLDEADRMLDMGFIHDMRSILEHTPHDRHTLFFSATMTKEAQRITGDFLRDPITVSVKKQDVSKSVAQDVVPYDVDKKFDTLLALLGKSTCSRVIIFGAMKRSVENLAKQLQNEGIKAESIHGNKTHSQRQRALQNFKSGRAQVLVATDVAARGIHVDNVSHVINYDLPNTFEDYVHRIGRTGRGVNSGQAWTFIPQSTA